MKLTPTLDRVAILPDPKQDITDGGIIIPDKSQKQVYYGTVVAIGPGGFNIDGSRRPMSVEVNDRVLFSGSHNLTKTGSKVVIVDDEDVLAIAK